MWGCAPHWFSLPVKLRNAIQAAYVPGQEITKTPSPRYIETARHVQQWIKENHRAIPRSVRIPV
jgi:hypothetical protein